MPLWGDVLVGIVVVVGLVGIVIQILPGSTLVGLAVAVWGAVTGGGVGWSVAAIAVGLTLASYLVKMIVAGRYLQRSGVPNTALIWGGVLGIVGFFAIPVVGLFLGFPLGVYAAERVRLKAHAPAWSATVAALKATGLTIVIELAFSLLVTGAWIIGLVAR